MSTHDPNDKHKGFYRRQKSVPHFDKAGLIQVITFRLADSLPAHALEQLKIESERQSDSEQRKRVEQFLDAGYGECYLKIPEIAELVEDALLFFDVEYVENMRSATEADIGESRGAGNLFMVRDGRYRLIAWVIMPNHVHVMIELLAGYPMDKIVQSWKSYSAKIANRLLGRNGQFWAEGYFDRFIRDQDHFNDAVRYLHNNPVKAGFVKNSADWIYSSARLYGKDIGQTHG